MEKPDTYLLSQIDWDLFVTLTFVREHMPLSLRRKYWFSFVRCVARMGGVHFRELLWVLRLEMGEINGRLHNHAVIGGLPDHMRNKYRCSELMEAWEAQKPLCLRNSGRKDRNGNFIFRMLSVFCGHPRIRIYDPAMNGLDYCLPQAGEGGSSEVWSFSGANQYELRKFSGSQVVEFSESLIRWSQRRGPAESIQRRCTRSAVTVQCRQVEVEASGFSVPIRALSPLPCSSAKDQSSTVLEEKCMTLCPGRPGIVKASWQDVGDGRYVVTN